jgi:four helix bundle protein
MPFDTYRDLRVYQGALELCLKVFERTKQFPLEERVGLVDQMRRSSRSVCANLAEAWHKRRYQAAFIAKLNDSESEAAETQVWIDIAWRCGYLDEHESHQFNEAYDKVLGQLVRMAQTPEKWITRSVPRSEEKPSSRVPLKEPGVHSSPSRSESVSHSPARSL